MRFRLGDHVHDVTDRTLVMGILNRTPDSFFDAGETFALDALFRRAEQLVAEGADVLDVGGVKAGPGQEVTEAEELDRVVPAIEALHARFDTPLSVDTSASERALRAVAVGRKNYLFAGSNGGGRSAAVLYSVIGTCRRLGLDPFAYLRDVLERVCIHPAGRIAELLPDR